MSNGGNDSGQHQPSPLGDPYADSRTPDRFTAWIRTRGVGTRCDLTIHGAPATITSASAHCGAFNPTAEYGCWEQLRAAVHVALKGDTETAATMLPAEVAAAEWVHHGKRTRIHQPGAATRALRCARRGLKALTPLPPLLGALSQPLAGGATAAGFLLAPIPLPSGHEPPPISMPYVTGRTLTGDIYRPAPGSVAGIHPPPPAIGPGAPVFPAILPRSTLFPAAGDSSERDTAPTPAPAYTPPPSSQRTAPAPSPTLSSAPTVNPTPSPSPTVTGTLDAPSPSPTPSSTTTPEPEPTVTPSHAAAPTLKHVRHRHHGHPLRRIHRRG